MLVVADNGTGYFGVSLSKPGQPKPYQARVWRGGKVVHLGRFDTAEEAASCVALSPEGRKAAAKLDNEVFPEACVQLAASALRLQLDLNSTR